ASGERRPFRDRDDRGPSREGGYQGDERSRPFSRDSRDERPGTRARYGRDDREADAPPREPLPEVEPDITAEELDKEVREELRSLPGDLAELVGRHMVAAERALAADDPDKAHEHTKVARRFAARIGVVREAAGIVAYRAGHFSEALSDLRAARRMTGSDAYLPVMADCERGMGRPERALDLVRSPEAERLDRAGRIELSIVESGARRDLGQHDAAVITLQRLPELRDPQPKPWSARLAFAYADALAEAGHDEAAADWFGRAMAFDEDGETDAAERYAELTGAVIEDVEEEFDYEDDFDDAGASATGPEVDDEADDAAAFAEAGDLLEGPAADESESSAGDDSRPDDVLDGTDGPESDDEARAAGDDPEPGDVLDEPQDVAADGSPGRGVASAEEREGGTESSGSDDDSASEAETADSAVPEAQASEAAPSDAAPSDAAPSEAAQSETESSETESSVTDESAAEARDSDAGQAKSTTSSVPNISPAFIEPDFGDILNQPGEGSEETPKRDG
ncbi:hypothetical protein, partial [Nonomuraea sp. LPB2021202275-12-8]|uniref:hypothetical protein n=1 Tax=Nonomuraea sp. LPB2021202275-12-8 TaxID=3120159 RepID=UPI00300C6144